MKWKDLFHKSNEYAKTATSMKIDEHADPEVQLEQAINAANERNDLLTDQAAQVIGDQKIAENRLHKLLDAEEDARTDAASALQLAAKYPEGSPENARYMQAAHIAAGKVASVQTQVEHQKEIVAHATAAATEAHEAVSQNAEDLQAALMRRAELVQDLHNTKMEETLHATMSSLKATQNQTIPTLDQVEEKILARKAKAIGYSEIAADSPEHALAEVHHASQNAKGDAILDEIRGELGMAAPAAIAPAPAADEKASK